MREEMAAEELEELVLRSHLAELARVFPWIDSLSIRYAIPEKTRYAINLCLEEALSNVVRHAYAGDTGQPIVVQFQQNASEVIFTIEDEGPHFRPTSVDVPEPLSLEELTPGGLGIPLMQRFADRVEWEPLAKGNRLRLGFLRRA